LEEHLRRLRGKYTVTFTQQQEEILRGYFDPKDGLGYKLCRIHMNSCDFCTDSYSCDDVEGDTDLKYFNIERDKKMVIPLLKRIKEYCPDLKILVSPLESACMDENKR